MSLWSRIKHELIDVIEFPDGSTDTLVYRFPRFEDQIKYGAKLIVREGQTVVFVNEGKLADIFVPGTYTLETNNLPVLSTLQGWKYGFTSPFKAEVYFLSTRPVLNLQWGTQQAITLELSGYGIGAIRAFGQASYRISDVAIFFRQIVGTKPVIVNDDLRDYIRGVVLSGFAEALTESHPRLEQLQANMEALSQGLQGSINLKLKPFGFELVQFIIESLSLPSTLNEELQQYSRLDNIDLGKFTQFQVAKSITDVANQGSSGGTGGLAPQLMQLGVGVSAAQQVMKALDGAFAAMPPGSVTVFPPATDITAKPALYHVSLDGKAEGPIGLEQITALVASGKVNASTLVWHPGMTAWATAGTEPALQSLFPQQPPPLP
jgi:membrane protease subunit (stomatin/prohibitin family)